MSLEVSKFFLLIRPKFIDRHFDFPTNLFCVNFLAFTFEIRAWPITRFWVSLIYETRWNFSISLLPYTEWTRTTVDNFSVDVRSTYRHGLDFVLLHEDACTQCTRLHAHYALFNNSIVRKNTPIISVFSLCLYFNDSLFERLITTKVTSRLDCTRMKGF